MSDLKKIKEYYSQNEVQKELMRLSQNREVQAWFGDIRGKRPEIVNFQGDINDLVKQGMTSFHVSEEIWKDPMMLESGLSKKELDNLRIGWSCILDLDSKNLNFSIMCAEFLEDALRFNDVKNFSIKYSGNRGFHIGIPFEAFPSNVNNVNIKDYFPDGVRVISEYLKNMIKEHLSAKILETHTVEDAAKSVGKKVEDVIKENKLDPFKLVDIDSVLISSRHLFRCAYSINEKSGLVSIPLKTIKDFDIRQAKIDNVKFGLKFLDSENVEKDEAKNLLIQAFDWARKTNYIEEKQITITRKFEAPKVPIKVDYFPPCILKLMQGVEEDGRKRGIFILVNFLQNVGWNLEDIEKFMLEWNKRNAEPLREGYVKAQISWFKRQKKLVLPPNCDNPSYYKTMSIKCDDGICSKCKNPVNYALKMLKMASSNVKKKSNRH
ncbi:hypothetical protein J4216_01725 [Candidatus Woesearchaeota archaeon]|nr:hypothetical protein [Candidatus Woesearchaeota archaeon]